MHASARSTEVTGNKNALDPGARIIWRSPWRPALWALLIALALSTRLLFHLGLWEDWPIAAIVLGWLDYFTAQLIVVGSIFAAVVAAVAIPTESPAIRHGKVLLAISLGAVIGERMVVAWHPLPPDAPLLGVLVARAVRWLIIGGLGYFIFISWRRADEAAALVHDVEMQRLLLERQMTEVQLQSLRAQIEPHFLFNTLANVRSLYSTEPAEGRELLASYLAYVRAALPQMRCHETTLAQEVDLARAYLSVLQLRMGRRLGVRFDVPEPLGRLPFPPLALSTLTENAIKHGLNPMPQGGLIEISARTQDDRLSVCVADTGAGVRDSGGAGSGLANLRARLAALYGETAAVRLETNTPCGIRATIDVPLGARLAYQL